MSGDKIIIEQRLQDPWRILFFSVDDFFVAVVPTVLGLLSKHPLEGVIVGFVILQGWKFLKGDGGTQRLGALAYWYLPKPVNICRGFPDSGITEWRG